MADNMDRQNLVTIIFEPDGNRITVPQKTNLFEALQNAGNRIRSECGGQGTCGKCKVIVRDNMTLTDYSENEKKYLSLNEIQQNYRLACQAHIKKDTVIFIPPESRIEERKIQITGYETEVDLDPIIEKFHINIPEPTLNDLRSDLHRLTNSLNEQNVLEPLKIDYDILRSLPSVLRKANWEVTVTTWDRKKIIAVEESDTADKLYGLAIDVGTSKIVVYIVDLQNGETKGIGFVENPQIMYGEDLITRISFTIKEKEGLKKLQEQTINGINIALKAACDEARVNSKDIHESVIVGNTAMHHFLLGLEPKFIATSPFTSAIKKPFSVEAEALNIKMNPTGMVYSLPIIAGFVGADAVADVLSSGIYKSDEISLLLDIGTNTEIFVGNSKDIISCSCASGPAFEGGHIKHGMKAVTGAIEKVSIDKETFEVNYETIGNGKPRGLCGSAIVDVVAEMLNSGIIDSRGKFFSDLKTPRIKINEGKTEFVLVKADNSATKHDIVVTQKDITEIQLAKAAIYAGCSMLMKKKGFKNEDLDRIMIAGAFGRYINPERAKIIGLVPDIPTEKIKFIGNTAVTGAKMALLSREARKVAEEISQKVRYLELSIDPEFRTEFTSALFLPHRDLNRFPSIKEMRI
jgi:uncharacterized 2Fe-2S/4Fe-4S cluster protein (DUF4445 family)